MSQSRPDAPLPPGVQILFAATNALYKLAYEYERIYYTEFAAKLRDLGKESWALLDPMLARHNRKHYRGH